MITFLAALALQAHDGFRENFPLQNGGICYLNMEFYDSPAIVQSVRVVDRTTVNGNGRLDRDVVFRIIDAQWAARGTEQTVALPQVPREYVLVIPPGRRYLLIAAKAQKGQLRIPLGTWRSAEIYKEYPSRTEGERVGLALFETPADRLPREGPADARLAMALADCFASEYRDRLTELRQFWEASRLPRITKVISPPEKFHAEDAAIIDRLLQIAATKPKTDRALMYYTMIHLGILGTEGLLIQTLYACLQDPNVFQDGFSIPTISLGPNPPKYENNMPDPNRCVDELLAARNIVIRNVLIKDSLPTPSVDQQRKFARFLDDEDAEVRRNTVHNLAMWSGKLDKVVTYVRDRETHAITYPDLNEKVAWWKQYWREH